MRSLELFLVGFTLVALSACQEPEQKQANDKSVEQTGNQQETATKKLSPSAFKTIEWTDLMPKEDFEALSNPPSYLNEIEDGSPEDQISNQVANAIENAADDRYQQALASTRVVPEMDGKAIKIPGFVVPLEFDENRAITEFFLVPFFGACIHVPPPPPNQVIHVSSPEGFTERELYNPFWISGIVRTSYTSNQVASATYSMEMQYFEMYSVAQ